MAIQDDNTVLKKADLKAYHEAIAPMLGGSFMLGTNVSDYYSTDEKIVGVWTDGKPLYQKTIVSTLPTASEEGTLGNRSINIANLHVDTVVYSQAIVENIAKCYFNLPWPFKNGSAITTFHINPENMPETYASSRNYLVLENGHMAWNDCSVFVTIQYTKTTDVANSAATTPGCYDINFPNTWPENKEIFFGNGLYGQRFIGTLTSAASTRMLTHIYNYPIYLVSYGGYVTYNSSGDTMMLGYHQDDTNYVCALYAHATDGLYLFTKSTDARTNAPYDIWTTYTK